MLAGIVLFLLLAKLPDHGRDPWYSFQAVLALAASLMSVISMTFNLMSLGGMAAAVGLIIDDIIVMLEHLFRRIEESPGEALMTRIDSAAREFMRPLMSSSAATLVIFVPLAFLGGVAVTRALSLTMAIGLTVSFVATWLIVPLLSERLLGRSVVRERRENRMAERYEKLLSAALARPRMVLVGVLVLIGLGALAYMRVGSGFTPAVDEGGFVLDYRTVPARRSRKPTVCSCRSRTSCARTPPSKPIRVEPDCNSATNTEAFEGDFFVRLKAHGRDPIDSVMDQVRSELEANVPGLDVELLQLMEDLIGDLTSVPQPIEVKLYSDDARLLTTTAQNIAAAIAKVDGIVDINNGTNVAGNALTLHVDRRARGTAGPRS